VLKEKYRHNFWRPVIGIHWGNNDTMPGTAGDAVWEPLGSPLTNTMNMSVTPAFPRCVSGLLLPCLLRDSSAWALHELHNGDCVRLLQAVVH
jgi:hypothetical protein